MLKLVLSLIHTSTLSSKMCQRLPFTIITKKYFIINQKLVGAQYSMDNLKLKLSKLSVYSTIERNLKSK